MSTNKPTHDYDHNDFYLALEGLAGKGYTDAEIADAINLTPQVFSNMKNGCYKGWDEKQNTERSGRIKEVLSTARRKINALLRTTYLQMALGARKVTSQTKRWIEDRCECNGQDPQCPYCGGTGRVVSTTKAIVQETEAQLAPSMQAITTWLFQHDPEWVKAKDGAVEEVETAKGFDVSRWIEGMSMAEQLKSIEEADTTTE